MSYPKIAYYAQKMSKSRKFGKKSPKIDENGLEKFHHICANIQDYRGINSAKIG